MKTLIFKDGRKRVTEDNDVIEALIEDGYDFKILDYNDETDSRLGLLEMCQWSDEIIDYK